VRKHGLCVSVFDAMCVCVLCALDVCARGLVHRCEGGTECVGMYVLTSVCEARCARARHSRHYAGGVRVVSGKCTRVLRRVGARCSGVESVF
jgi:hypothetical protein